MVEPPSNESRSSSDADPDDEPALPPERNPEPDQAWRALGLVNDWIKHADAKVGATLAASGAVGVLLYNLVRSQDKASTVLIVFTVLCAVAAVAAGGSAALALMPRLTIATRFRKATISRTATSHAQPTKTARDRDEPELDEHEVVLEEDPVNLLFFSNIAREYDGDGPSYVEVLRSLTSDPERLTRQIAHQVHANATVAHRKFTWADRAIKALVLALLFLCIVAITVA